MIDNARSRVWCFAVGPRLDRGVSRLRAETTVIYTHALKVGGLGVCSPLIRMLGVAATGAQRGE